MTDLRRELGARDPEWTMLLPAGWERLDVDEASLQDLLRRLRTRLMQQHAVQAYAAVSQRLRASVEQLRDRGGVAMLLPLESVEGHQYLPASVSAAFVGGSEGELDKAVERMVRDGATALADDRRWVRVRRTVQGLEGEERAAQTTVRYLTPVPGTKRRRALVLTATIVHDETWRSGDEFLEGVVALIDAHVTTFRWSPREGGE